MVRLSDEQIIQAMTASYGHGDKSISIEVEERRAIATAQLRAVVEDLRQRAEKAGDPLCRIVFKDIANEYEKGE